MANAAQPVASNRTPLKDTENGVAEYDPRAYTRAFDFSLAASFEGDLFIASGEGKLQFVQGVYIDNMDNASSFTLTFPATGQRIVAQPYTQGTYPVMAITPTRYSVRSAGNVVVTCLFQNYPTPYFVWGETTLNGSGGGAGIPVNPIQNVTWTTTKIVLTGGANDAGLPVNAARKAWKISAYSGNAAPVNYSFNNAATGATSCPELTQAGSDKSDDINSTQAITLFGTAGDIVWVSEGVSP